MLQKLLTVTISYNIMIITSHELLQFERGVDMKNESFILEKIKEYISEDIVYYKKLENEYNEAARIDYTKASIAILKQEARHTLECLEAYITGLEASPEV